MVERIKYRQSEFTAWQDCRRRHDLSYRQKLVPVRIEGQAVDYNTSHIGTLVHTGVEAFHRGGDLPSAVSAVNAQLASWDQPEWSDILFTAIPMIETYVDWVEEEGIDVGVETLAVEHAWEAPLEAQYAVHGTMDLVTRDHLQGGVVIEDIKTVGSFAQQPASNNFQLLTYAWGWWRTTGEVPVAAGHRMIKRNKRTATAKPPFNERYLIPIDETALRLHELQLFYRAEEMYQTYKDENPAKLWPNPGKDCSWKCSFKDVCPMYEAGADVVDFLSTHFAAREEEETEGEALHE